MLVIVSPVGFRRLFALILSHLLPIALVTACPSEPAVGPESARVHAQRAQRLMLEKKDPEAVPHWQVALRLDPTNARYHNLYGLALQAVGQVEEAQKEFKKAIQIQPSFFDGHANLGYSLAQSGKVQEAAEAFERALKLRPSDPAANLARGLVSASTDDSKVACTHFDRARPWPIDASTLWTIFSTCLSGESLVVALEAASSLPKDAHTQLKIGEMLARSSKPKEAVPFLLASSRQDPSSASTVMLLADAYLSSGNPGMAIQTITQMKEGDRNTFGAIEILGSALLKQGLRSEAKIQFDRLLKQYSDIPDSYIHATQIPLEDEDWQKALSILDQGLVRIQNNWLLLFRRGMTYKMMGRLKQARTDLVDAIGRGGDVAVLSAALGEVYAELGDLPGASELFRITFVETQRPEFQFAFALSLQRQGDDVGALRELKKAVELLPKNARVHFEYGKLLKRSGQIMAAKEEFEHARQLDPKYSPNLYALSRTYLELGDQKLAAKATREFQTSKPVRD